MTSADKAFRARADQLSTSLLSHPAKGFACMLELPPHSTASHKSNPTGWTRAAMLFVQNLVTRHTDNVDVLPLLENLEEVYAWAGDLRFMSDDHIQVTNEMVGVVTVLWKEQLIRVRLDVWYSRMAKRMQARLEWDTANAGQVEPFTNAGLDELVALADMHDLLVRGEGYIDNPTSL